MSDQNPSTDSLNFEDEQSSKHPEYNPATINQFQLPFGKQNYRYMIISLIVLILGYFLLSSNEFVDATEFSVPLHIAPFVIAAGYIGLIYAILYKPKKA